MTHNHSEESAAGSSPSTSNQIDRTPAGPKGGPEVLILLLVVAIPAVAVGQLLHVGSATIIVAFVALTTLMASIGGALRSDLQILLAVGPVIAIAATAPRLLAEISPLAAIPLITLLIFVAALLPIRGPRFATVGMGLGMATLLAYAIPLNGPTGPGQLLPAAALGVLVAAALRTLMGIGDPNKVVRTAIADVLTNDNPDLGAAFGNWLAARPAQWLGEALTAAARYRTGYHALQAITVNMPGTDRAQLEDTLATLRSRASVIAEQIRSKHAPAPGIADEAQPNAETGVAATAGPASVPAGLVADLAGLHHELDRAQGAALARDTSRVAMPGRYRRRVGTAIAQTVLHARTAAVRHALRTTLGVFLALLVSLRLPTGDPLLPTLLITVFTVLQTTWTASLAKARQRVLGVVVGALAVALTILLAPASWALPIAIAGLIVGLWNITARPAVSVAAMIVMSVGINSALRHTDPTYTLLEYVGLTLAAVLLGFVVGFAVVPAPRRASFHDRAEDALSRTAQSLRLLAGSVVADPEATIRQQREAEAARQELTSPDDTDADRRAAGEKLSELLGSLIAVAITIAHNPSSDRDCLDHAAQTLAGEPVPRAAGEGAPIWERAVLPIAVSARELADTFAEVEKP